MRVDVWPGGHADLVSGVRQSCAERQHRLPVALEWRARRPGRAWATSPRVGDGPRSVAERPHGSRGVGHQGLRPGSGFENGDVAADVDLEVEVKTGRAQQVLVFRSRAEPTSEHPEPLHAWRVTSRPTLRWST